MWIDPAGGVHPNMTDAYDIEGASHIAFCQVCSPHFHLIGPPPQAPSYGNADRAIYSQRPANEIPTSIGDSRNGKKRMKTFIKWGSAIMVALFVLMFIWAVLALLAGSK
jgi:hypothetical protein